MPILAHHVTLPRVPDPAGVHQKAAVRIPGWSLVLTASEAQALTLATLGMDREDGHGAVLVASYKGDGIVPRRPRRCGIVGPFKCQTSGLPSLHVGEIKLRRTAAVRGEDQAVAVRCETGGHVNAQVVGQSLETLTPGVVDENVVVAVDRLAQGQIAAVG